MKIFADKITVDIGTSNTRMYLKGKGLVIDEPSVIAYEQFSKDVLAVGLKAKSYIGKTPKNIISKRPFTDGIIDDIEVGQLMIKHFFKIIKERYNLSKVKILISIKENKIDRNIKIIIESAKEIFSSKILLIDEQISALVSLINSIEKEKSKIIINFGGGNTRISILKNNDFIFDNKLNIGSDKITFNLINYLLKNYDLHVGENTAENCKIIALNNMKEDYNEETFNISGKNIKNNTPKAIYIYNNEILKNADNIINRIIDSLSQTFENINAEVLNDIKENGIYLTGGGSLLKRFKYLIEEKFDMKCNISKRPIYDVIDGSGMIIEKASKYKKLLIKK